MRNRRAIIFDDEPIVLDVLRVFFESRGYEAMLFREPVICPIYGDSAVCPRPHPCSDIMLTDYKMPKMNGVDLLIAQSLHGCKLLPQNKALMSGFIDDNKRKTVEDLGIAFFQKPVDFNELDAWVSECEARTDLAQTLAIKRREPRHACCLEIQYGTSAQSEAWRGVTVNMSNSGLCLRTSKQLDPRQTISIRTNPPRPPQQASVRWVKEAGDGAYFVGLSFST